MINTVSVKKMATTHDDSFAYKASLVCLVLYLVASVESSPRSALVTKLPGFNGTFPSKHYSGYVSVGSKKLFYYLVESERNPAKDPVVLWLNGGPGCSSFDGFVYEHGPFNFEAPKSRNELPKLHLNPYSWSKVSNIIYLDSPAGVGYSYSTNKQTDYKTGDKQTALDTHAFLLKWFEIYKKFQSNPFYLSGESYAGIYVPTLAHEVVKGLDAGLKPVINFKGYMVGNAVTDKVFDGNALVPFVHGMGFISDQLYRKLAKACKRNYYNITTVDCANLLLRVRELTNDLNIYNVLEPCYHDPTTVSIAKSNVKLPESFKKLGETERPLLVRKRMFGRAWPHGAIVEDGIVPSWSQLSESEGVPCIDDREATAWLNNVEVRKALHAANETIVKRWLLCTSDLTYEHDTGSMIQYHRNLTSRGYAALIFSGDHDMCVPYTGSEAWTRSMGYKVIDEWRPWYTRDQVAGFLQGYEKNLTFLTIKGSGHTVPEYKPQEALHFYSRWLAGKRI